MNSTCPYCGVGCGVTLNSLPDGKVQVSGDSRHPANFGRLCVKGAALGETLGHQGRLLWPQLNGQRVSWEQALDRVAQGLQQVIAQHGPQAVAFYASGQLLTEDYYAANKLMKGFIGSGNIDTNSRLCMASAVVGYKRAFGADAVPCCYDDFSHSDLIVLVGSNTAWAHPVAYQRLVAAKKQRPAMQVVVIDPRRTASCDLADLHLPLRPGSDGALFAGLLHWLAQHQGIDNSMLAHLSGVEPALAAAAEWHCEAVAAFCQLELAQVEAFYQLFARSPQALTLYCMGINQSTSGSDKCNAIINVHLLSGKLGRAGSGPFSLTGQPNAMGGREVGGLANQLAAHMAFTPQDIDRLQRFWHSDRVAQQPGLKAVELFQAVERGEVKAVWIMGSNPAVSLPDSHQVAQALARCELVIVSDVSQHTDTTAYADVLLPAQGWGEKNGTVTNSERRISRQRGFVAAPGEAKPDWWMIAAVAQRMGFGAAFAWRHPAQIFREHAALSGFENQGARAFDISGLATLTDGEWDTLQPIQWPVNAHYPQGCARLFSDRRFFHADGKARLLAIRPRLPATQVSDAWPLLMNSGRIRDQWHTMTRTGSVPRLMQHRSEPFADLHPQDAQQHQINEGDLVRVQSASGWIVVRAHLTDAQQRGTLFVPMHWTQQFTAEGNVDRLVAAHLDPHSGQPESKQTPVRLRRWQSDWQGMLLVGDNVTIPHVGWWARIPHQVATQYQLAADGDPQRWLAQQCDLSGLTIQYAQGEGAFYRLLGWRDGMLVVAFYADGLRPQIDTALVAQAFLQPPATAAARHALLAGRAADGAGHGKIICSCLGIGEQQIITAIAGGCDSAAALGKTVGCGTHCGSCIPELKQLIARCTAMQPV
ncbi:assimilatory nitrate reductase catalytic subunit [Erwinia toletana]|uniref:Assimilatory nitrate reductase catalytic subunit n=1 Tax=Winslowiella toletana TaxID=92490 RepID=A0ABS4PET3_9GAMM|nr:nitrate reductase [Winslowiella toletana]MBP2171149.1 assimilatory nitrate reductase catalytic subunit [Winslowiella toletana]